MKKQFTLLAGILLVGGSVFGQTPTTAKSRLKNIALDTQKYPVGGTSTQKFEGEVLWESDFSDASDWTITTAGQGTWVIGTPTSQPDLGTGTGNPSNGLQTGYGYGTTGQNFTPPTKSNGYAGFNGIKFLLAPPVQTQNASLTSESINFTGRNVVTVSFYQWYRAFNSDDVYLEYSADGGATWPAAASYPLNGSVATNTFTTGNYTVDLNVNGSANGKIRFRWENLTVDNNYGSGYGWAIDDVKITDGANEKANILFAFQSTNEDMIKYTKFPSNQVTGTEVITFWTHIQNAGNNPLTTTLNVTSTGGYNETSAASTSQSLMKDTLEILTADGFTIPAAQGVHNFVYKVGATSDLSNTSDTARTLPFEVTNHVMAVDAYDGTPASITGSFGNWSTQVAGDFTGIGNFFVSYKAGTIGGVQVGFDQVSAADSTLFTGLPFTVTLLKQGTDGFASVYQTDGEIASNYFGNLITVYFDEAITCAPGEGWAVIIGSQVTASGGAPVGFAGMNLAGNTVGSTSITASLDVSLASDPQTPDLVDAPVVRLMFGDWVSLSEKTLSAADLSVAPNPFSNETAINFNLDAAASVSAVVTDLSGRTVMTIPASTMNAGKQTLNIDGTSFNAGVYNVSVTINGNTATKRIVKK